MPGAGPFNRVDTMTNTHFTLLLLCTSNQTSCVMRRSDTTSSMFYTLLIQRLYK